MVQEQLLDALPRELKIWVAERKPKTSKEAAEVADNYLRASGCVARDASSSRKK